MGRKKIAFGKAYCYKKDTKKAEAEEEYWTTVAQDRKQRWKVVHKDT